MTNETTSQRISDQNQALARRFFAAQDELRGGPAPELCAEGYQAHLGGNPPVERAGHQAFAEAFYAAFDGMSHDVRVVIADASGVAVRFVLRGVHTGAFFGIPATGRAATIAANVLLEIEDGKVKTLYGMFDEAGMLRQLGVLPG